MSSTKIGVIGAGVIGLSTALNIVESIPDAEVTIMANIFSPNTTGDYSAGLWEPFVTSGANILRWSKVTFDHLVELAQSPLAGRIGAQFCSGYQLGECNINWSDIVLGFRPMTKEELALFPTSGVTMGSFFTTVMIECSMYLPWLMHRFKEKGGLVFHRRVNSFEEIADEFDLVVNCAGLAARDLTNDNTLKAIRGQVVKVLAPWIKHFVVLDHQYDPGHVAYVLPGAKAVTVGGTIQEGNWEETVDEKDKLGIWKRCTELLPSLTEAKYLYDWAGLRPFRPEVRLELEELKTAKGKQLPVIHNYGHGGSGVTLHWGCALDAVAIVKDTIQKYCTKSRSTHPSKL
ncbi:D-aspartate oxidase-like [Liolophura sinensis]|uniref:D-aspartate oxidase-like n=1 Tax=Liolophura sinensis TaxID=3198878 RepID=UPI0031593963